MFSFEIPCERPNVGDIYGALGGDFHVLVFPGRTVLARAPPLVTYVESKKDAEGKNEINLKEGELEKANKYAEDLAKKLQNKNIAE